MTVQEAKDFLRSIRAEQSEIDHLKRMIRKTECDLLPKGITYDKDKVQVCPEEKFSKICAKIASYQEELGETIVTLLNKKMHAEALIRQLDDEKEREVLRWYYLSVEDGYLLTWGQVAMRMNYNERYVKQIHGNALVHLVKKGE